jgi:cytochrome c
MQKSLIRSALVAAAWLAVGVSSAWAQTADDKALVQRGKRLFLQCAACHESGPSTITKIGPNLHGVFGRPVASLAGFNYTASLKSQKFTWDEAHLNQWIQRPTAIAPGTAMAFAGIPDENDRRAIIAFLKSIK